jgi:hypothetical protein
MFEITGPLYTVRLRLRARIRVSDDPPWYEPRDVEREVADHFINALDDSFAKAFTGVQWQDIYYSLERA